MTLSSSPPAEGGVLDPLVAALGRPLSPEEQGLVMSAGVQTRFNVPAVKSVPSAIRAIKPKTQQRRATDAWRAGSRLENVLIIWKQFLALTSLRARIDTTTEELIEKRHPTLAAVGGVLNRIAETVKWPPDLARILPAFDQAHGITRAPAEKHQGADMRPYRGRHILELVEQFRALLERDAECLRMLGVNNDTFLRPPKEIQADIAKVTGVDMDFTDQGPPIDGFAAMRGKAFRKAYARLAGGAHQLLQQLEDHPEVVLDRQQAQPTDVPRSPRARGTRMPALEINHKVRDYLTAHPRATRDAIAKAIGCSTGAVSKTPSWRAVSEKRNSRKRSAGKKVGMKIAEERKAEEQERERKDDEEFPLTPEEQLWLEGKTPDEKAEFIRIKREQEADRRADARRPRHRRS